jgi:hypothetical protein
MSNSKHLVKIQSIKSIYYFHQLKRWVKEWAPCW